MIRISELAFKAFKFGIVGLTGLLLDFTFTWILKERLHANKYLSNSIGFAIAAINNYIWNRLWTFKSHHEWGPELLRFLLFSIIGLGLNNLFLFVFHKKLVINFYMAKGMAIICVFAWNFVMNLLFNFN